NELHFSTNLGLFSQSRIPSDLSTLYGLIALAVILMLIACINFVNLATAQALQRSKEVGVRKVLGGSRKSIMWQFLGETSIIVLLAVCLSIVLTEVIFTTFTDFFPEDLVFEPFRLEYLVFYGLILVSVSLLSGFYPAFVLAAFKPVKALKSKGVAYTDLTSQNWLQKALITVQFVVSISLIIATLLVGKQITYIMNKDLGVSAESLVFFNVPYWDTDENKDQVLSEVRKLAGVQSVSIHTNPIVANSWSSNELSFHKVDEKQTEEVQYKWVDSSFVKTYELELLAGRNLKDGAREYLVNEAMVKQLGFTDPSDVIGMTVMDTRGDNSDVAYQIVGVINDYHYLPLQHQIDPMVLTSVGRKNTVGVKLEQGVLANDGFSTLIENIHGIYKQAFPRSEFDYEFMDEQIASYYEEEERMATLSQTATAVAIFISCIGLFGLISYSLVRRTKEIGIRKILGATVSNIFKLISTDFLKLILIAFIIATPITWYMMDSWLADYTYKAPISLWVFILSGVIACLLALITIGYQTFKAASANPVEALRME
ncbi:MAG: FtsX-like permease family protein, partial [Bacteroidota bacterium]